MRLKGSAFVVAAVLLCCAASAFAAVSGPVYPAPGGNTFTAGSGDTGTAGGRTSTYAGFDSSQYGSLWWGLSARPALSLDDQSYAGNEYMTLSSVAGNVATWTGQTYWCYANYSYTYPVSTRLTLTATDANGAVNWIMSDSVSGFPASVDGFPLNTPIPLLPVGGTFYLNFLFEAQNPVNGQWTPAKTFFDGASGFNHCSSTTGMGRSTSGGFWYTAPVVTNQPPVLAAIGDKSVQTATNLSFTISATDPENQTITYGITPLPSGASFDTNTGAFSWTPLFAQAGDHPVTFSATDSESGTDSEPITIHVTLPPGNVAPVMDPVGCGAVTVGTPVSFTLHAIDGNGDTVTFSANGLPSGASLDSQSGQFSWTPSADQSGSHQITFFASDGSLSDSETATVLVGVVAPDATSIGASFGIYNQGRGTSGESHVRAWVSDRGASHASPDGMTDVPVTLVSPATCATPQCTPALGSGSMATYVADVPVTAGGFGRLEADATPGNLAEEQPDGSFRLTAMPSATSVVSFRYGRYLWIEADAMRDEANQKLDESQQQLDELKANDAQHHLVSAVPPQFGDLTHLSATFSSVTGSGGAPHLVVHFLCNGSMTIHLGESESNLNVIGNNDAGRYDLSGLPGSHPASATYADALAAAGDMTITGIDFVVDDEGAGPSRVYTLSSMSVSTAP